MKRKVLFVFFLFILLFLLLSINFSKNAQFKPIVVWFVVAKYLRDDFLALAEKYKPDIVLLTVFAEDDILPLNGDKNFDLKGMVDELHKLNIKVFFSYSLFSRSMYEEIKNTSLPIEKYLHISSYSKYLRENEPERYHKLFDYYLEKGLDPEKIPMVERKPIDGFYVEIGHYSMINPLYKPYQKFLIEVINETIQIAKPDGLSFDHIRFFTFDECCNQDIRNFILENCGLDVYNYTPKPLFILNLTGWKKEDELYYMCRARLIQFAVDEILSEFPEYRKFGTTMGMIEPARANGQYIELQGKSFDGLLLMAYDMNPREVGRNVRETVGRADGKPIVLGISKLVKGVEMENIKIGLENEADGIYLLGYDFNESVHNYLLEIRKK